MGFVQPIVAGRVRQVEVVLAAAAAQERKVIPIRSQAHAGANGDDAERISLFEAQKTIHPRSVSGRFARWRWVMVWLTQLVFYGLPWLEWGQRQAVLFDLGARRFYIFGLVLYPQDFIYLSGLLVASALSLFLFTTLAGRLWCGYACPQTVYSEVFMWIERHIEGERVARMRLEAAPWSFGKAARKSAKHLAWLALALWTGFTFVGYFSPLRDLAPSLAGAGLASWEAFWVLFYAVATYGNAGFLREQVCMYMCPYARFQSAMFDRDTLVVSYDQPRGEPRGSRSRRAEPATLGLGACIDCTLCVQVCPTGIDIRKGLQYECIACGACADVCDQVMDKMGYARGLVRYATQNGIQGAWNIGPIWRRLLRPRVLVYAFLLTAVCVALLAGLWLRIPFKVDVVRDRGALARIVQGGMLENVYRLQIMNATESTQRYRLGVSGIAGLQIASQDEVQVDAAASRWVAVRLRLPYGAAQPGSQTMRFDIEALDSGQRISEKSVFMVPR